jgi:hypothetical protein
METIPDVFVVETLKFDDEEKDRFEGKMISHILNLHGKKSKYYYIRTKKELREIAKRFGQSTYRYLHLSCHGNESSMATTLDSIDFSELGSILRPHLEKRRLFVSACEMVNESLAEAVIPKSGCYSIIGPNESVAFSDAAIFWPSFYHLMFRHNTDAMKRADLLKHLSSVSQLYDLRISYFSSSRSSRAGYKAKYFGM